MKIVERRIGKLKNYKFLSRTLPIIVLKHAADEDFCILDRILLRCFSFIYAALTNLQISIMKDLQ